MKASAFSLELGFAGHPVPLSSLLRGTAGPVPRCESRSWDGPGEGSGVEVQDLIDAFLELPTIDGSPVTVVVNRPVKLGTAFAQFAELDDVRAASCLVPIYPRDHRVSSLEEILPVTLQLFDPVPDGFSGNKLQAGVGYPPRTVVGKQRRETAKISHDCSIDELTAQRLDFDAVSDAITARHQVCPPFLSTPRRGRSTRPSLDEAW
jgi:hypothetical protein